MDSNSHDRLLADNLYKLTDKSCESEMKRYISLLNTSSRLLTCNSIILVALAAAVTLVAEHSQGINEITIKLYVTVLVLISVSIFFCILCQWRFRYRDLDSPEQLFKMVYESRDKLNSELRVAASYCKTLDGVYISTEKRNNVMSLLLRVSVVLLAAVLVVITYLAVIAI